MKWSSFVRLKLLDSICLLYPRSVPDTVRQRYLAVSGAWVSLSLRLFLAVVLGSSILDHGINVTDVPVPHRLAERGW